MNNYEFCATWVISFSGLSKDFRVLDYGCGAGEIVDRLRKRKLEAYGCDVFYDGGDYSNSVNPEYVGSVIRRMENGVIPFPDNYFDVVVCNQVMEHVRDMDLVLREIARVLKPGGKFLSLFPDSSVWREGHCGIPFLHWFPKGNSLRWIYASALRSIGLGYHKGEKSIIQWSRDFCGWLDSWTFYRSNAEIKSHYSKFFHDQNDLEHEWLQKRCSNYQWMIKKIPRFFQALMVRKLMGLVFVVTKPNS